MSKDKVFVSFDWDHDKRYKFLLEAWDANPNFDFVFSDQTPQEIQSNDIGPIKAAISAKINGATHTLVIVGEFANTRHQDSAEIGFINWINFEVAKSIELKKRIAVVKLMSSNSVPNELSGASYAQTVGFEEEGIIDALNRA